MKKLHDTQIKRVEYLFEGIITCIHLHLLRTQYLEISNDLDKHKDVYINIKNQYDGILAQYDANTSNEFYYWDWRILRSKILNLELIEDPIPVIREYYFDLIHILNQIFNEKDFQLTYLEKLTLKISRFKHKSIDTRKLLLYLMYRFISNSSNVVHFNNQLRYILKQYNKIYVNNYFDTNLYDLYYDYMNNVKCFEL